MKTNSIIAGVIAVLFVAALGACFTDWDNSDGNGMGSISINLGDSSGRALTSGDIAKLDYTITLSSPGKTTITRSVKGGSSLSIQVASATWNIRVSANGAIPTKYTTVFPDQTNILMAEGQDTVKVKAGITTPARINMIEALEDTSDWVKLKNAFNEVNKTGTSKIIVVNENADFYSSGNTGEFSAVLDAEGATVTLIGNGAHPVIKLHGNQGSLFKVNKGTLVLKNLTLDGNNNNNNTVLVDIDGGNLVMEAGSTITGNTNNTTANGENLHGGGVRITGGTFTMNDGAVISHNTARDGAGVKVNYGATFIMNGGTITENTAQGTGSGTAGGVHVWESTFIMYNGVIAKNTATWHGGGVYIGGPDVVGQRGYFEKTGGTIYGNNGGENSNTVASGGDEHKGHAVYGGRAKFGICDSTVTGYLLYDGVNGSPTPIFTPTESWSVY